MAWTKVDKYNLYQLETLGVDTSGYYFSMDKVDDRHFVVAHGSDDGSFVKTFEVNNDYEVTMIDSLKHFDGNTKNETLCMIDDDHFVLSYSEQAANDMLAKTFSIDSDYNITYINDYRYGQRGLGYHQIVKIDSNHCILAYNYYLTEYHAVLKTFNINSSYQISEVDTLEHDLGGFSNAMVKLSDDKFILAFDYDADQYGAVKVVSIDSSYNISIESELQHNTDESYYFSVCLIDRNHFAVVYLNDTDVNGIVKTFSLDEDYLIEELDSLIHYDGGAYNHFIIKANSEHLLLTYLTDSSAFTKVIKIGAQYKLTQDQTTEVGGDYGNIINIYGPQYILAYSGLDYISHDYKTLRFVSDTNIWEVQ